MNRVARALYEKALALDPHYAQACAYLAVTHLYDREFSWVEPGATPLETGFEYAARSVALDEADAETQSALAYACLHDRQFDRAEFHFDQAVQLNPNDAIANGLKGMSLLFRGQSPEAIETIRRSRDLNPLAPDWDYWNLGIAYYGLDDYVQATAMFNRVANRPSELYALLAACYAMLGREAEAREHMAEFHSRMARDPARLSGRRPRGRASLFRSLLSLRESRAVRGTPGRSRQGRALRPRLSAGRRYIFTHRAALFFYSG